jgi:phosphoserine phosphatase
MENKPLRVAFIYDFDGTLSPGNMQEYDFIPAVGKSNAEFWEESNDISAEQDADPILTYMAKMITEAKRKGLSLKRDAFRKAGKNILFFDGVLTWFKRVNDYAASKGIEPLHYINSSGIREIIEGTEIAGEFKNIYASSFLYDDEGAAYWPAVGVNYTNKTQFIYKINKGVESVSDSKLVNMYLEEEKRHVQFKHMIYVGDGTTDIPCMRLVDSQGGYAIAVHDPNDDKARHAVSRLIDEKRVSFVCPADYSEDSRMFRLVKLILDKIATDNELRVMAKDN